MNALFVSVLAIVFVLIVALLTNSSYGKGRADEAGTVGPTNPSDPGNPIS